MGIEVRSADGRWWYDCVYKAEGYEVALEVYHTHATTQEKIKATRQSGMQLAEFSADEVNAMKPGAELHNLQIVTRICGQQCKDAQRARVEKQQFEMARQREEQQRWEEARRAQAEKQKFEVARQREEQQRWEEARRAQAEK
ncbi:MAG: hypothetical protein WCN95_16185, partial [bacterium]